MRICAVLTLATLTYIFAGCSSEIVSNDRETDRSAVAAAGAAKTGADNGAVTVPFEADFFSVIAPGSGPDPETCEAPFIFLNVQEGHGEATQLGRFSFHATFCMDMRDLADNVLEEGESLPYRNGVVTMTAANGDELWLTISGEVVPSDHPDFDFEFQDEFQIVGGTGRFDGASGNGVTDSLVDTQTQRTEHHSSGTLTISQRR